ncbi:imidazole glycerol phosphate synthase subunit HisH [Eubacteriales bacterium OttesenSCG-928-K08]|nr:imidazole glycerol phosphate synthase subunit HisH [Eubacteriales bacterium OttesenSCG-928-K08]
MLAVIDYGVGNLFSLSCALEALGVNFCITDDQNKLIKADRIILPGVGAFGDAIRQFRASGLEAPLAKAASQGKPILGICVGMQLLFEAGYEFGEHEGLGFIKGSIHSLRDDIPPELKIPHIGWNSLKIQKPDDPIFRYIKQNDYAYYVHSFYAKGCEKSVLACSQYGVEIPGVVKNKNVYGTQFHPEKSGEVGQGILKAFCEL